ncbi:DUF2924 domain-containing protein [Burkholderia thailandensis]|uniref:DUF2924 domain-containing protein n=1 Tax=Burkholderia thailandensis TaxID=57975 RepID=UPI000759B987|nr:DUF2924 domain-containing protein [Burkholderia thailandensis]KVG09864.1 elements of external origin [Burkholderia thailandensis]
MTTHAGQHSAVTIAARIAQLPNLPIDSLWALWDEYFDERPKHHNRTWIETRLAYRMQERAFGGLRVSLRRKFEEIGETGIMPRQVHRAGERLLPGTVITRTYNDIDHRVLVRGINDFEYQGMRFRSLTAIAREITGSNWSGPVFFGLKSGRRKAEAA